MSNVPQDPVAQTECDYPRSGSLDILSKSVLLALVVCALYFGREIFVPIAIAILLVLFCHRQFSCCGAGASIALFPF